MKKIALLGSTGSIGTQTLQVIKDNKNLYKVQSLVAFSNVEILSSQAKEFGADYFATILNDGIACLEKAVDGADLVVVATRGMVALKAVLKALKQGKTVALANKETLVCGGEIVKEYLNKYSGKIYTVDSEHSAIWQCLEGNKKSHVKRIVLTASGGAFRNFSVEQLKTAKAQDALKHPTWDMGSKITIDSATMMNKGLEIIEASYLFDIPQEKIDVVIHPQSIVHSMVEYEDGSVMAQMSNPDMRLPIQYALSYPNRIKSNVSQLDLIGKKLEFYALDSNKFKCMQLCRKAFEMGGLYPAVLNAANDICVEEYLNDKIGFFDIPNVIEKVLQNYEINEQMTVDGLFTIDRKVKEYTKKLINGEITIV
ncbi:MAG: 1-deoxy-D-xylulose-5-phosphate reductoisomerase [Clostridiales bacterium]|nr:1-deoxy-D-xylulose-5-phosphate reductoisomerase [Clostridiales bacterium]